MKKIITVMLSLVIVSGMLCLTGCGEPTESDYIGTWKSTTCMVDGKEAKTADTWGAEFSLNLKDNNKATATLIGMDTKGTWKLTKKGNIKLTTKAFTDITLKPDDDGNLEMTFGESTIIFEKSE